MTDYQRIGHTLNVVHGSSTKKQQNKNKNTHFAWIRYDICYKLARPRVHESDAQARCAALGTKLKGPGFVSEPAIPAELGRLAAAASAAASTPTSAGSRSPTASAFPASRCPSRPRLFCYRLRLHRSRFGVGVFVAGVRHRRPTCRPPRPALRTGFAGTASGPARGRPPGATSGRPLRPATMAFATTRVPVAYTCVCVCVCMCVCVCVSKPRKT